MNGPPNNSVIVIGNGPSTRALADFGFPNIPPTYDTIGMGLAHRYYESIGWMPTYYGQLDCKVVYHHQREYRELVKRHPEVRNWFFCTKYGPMKGMELNLGDDPHIIPCGHSGTGIGLAKAMSLIGYRRILIIGVDGNWEWNLDTIEWLNENEEKDNRAIIINAELHNRNYFCNYYRNGDVISFKHGGGRTDPKDVAGHWKKLIDGAKKRGVKIYSLSQDCAVPAECPYNDIGEALRELANG